MSKAVSGIGLKLQRGDGASPEVFTTVAEVLSIKGPSEKLDTHDVTNMDSPAAAGYTGIYREFIATLLDGGDVTFDINYLPNDASQLGLSGDRKNKILRDFQIVLPNDPLSSPLASLGTLVFKAYVVEGGYDFPIDKQMTESIKLKITGPVNYVAGA